MTNWRESASQSVQDDLDRLFNVALEHATDQLRNGGRLTLDCAPGLRVEAEHRERVALALRVPYRYRFLGGLRLGAMQLRDGPARLWR